MTEFGFRACNPYLDRVLSHNTAACPGTCYPYGARCGRSLRYWGNERCLVPTHTLLRTQQSGPAGSNPKRVRFGEDKFRVQLLVSTIKLRV